MTIFQVFVPVTVVLASFALAGQQTAGKQSGSASNPPRPESSRPLKVRVSEGVARALLIEKVEPAYPEEARKAHIEGSVVLRVTIDTDGTVQDIKLVSDDPMLAASAIEAVKQWKYKPYLLNGQPAIVEAQVTVAFKLVP
jgi:protein TonB